MRQAIFWLATVIVFSVPNVMIWQKEKLRTNGTTVLLKLAPVDPRSLIQGDYMILDYAIARKLDYAIARKLAGKKRVRAKKKEKVPKDGHIVITLDKNRVGKFMRIHRGKQKLKKGELLFRYRFRKGRWRIGANAFFFQEGHAKYYNKARYGEYRVTPSGDSLLIGLRSPDFKIIKAPKTKRTPQSKSK